MLANVMYSPQVVADMDDASVLKLRQLDETSQAALIRASRFVRNP